MRQLSAEARDALAARHLSLRDFVWFVVRDRDTGNEVAQGYWSETAEGVADVLNPLTGAVEARPFEGAGSLIQIGQIVQVAQLKVQPVKITLSQLADSNALFRTYDARQGRVEIYRALYRAGTHKQIAPAESRFLGFIDELSIQTGAEGDEGRIEMSCVSHTQELTRSNPATRSDAYLRKRAPDDAFRQHSAVVGTWDIVWGASS